jgi:hypothetical protein
MGKSGDIVWDGERNRQLDVYRACRCGVCSKSRKGVGYLSFSDASGRGFTIWIEDEKVFRRLRQAIRRFRQDRPDNQPGYVAREHQRGHARKSSRRMHEL